MAIKVNWSEESIRTFETNIQYLSENWSEKEVTKFIQQTAYVISRLHEHPESYNPSLKKKHLRRARLNKHVTLYYQYSKKKKEIVLLSFWNTQQDPAKAKY